MRMRVAFPKQDELRFLSRPFCAGVLPHHLHIWMDCLIKPKGISQRSRVGVHVPLSVSSVSFQALDTVYSPGV